MWSILLTLTLVAINKAQVPTGGIIDSLPESAFSASSYHSLNPPQDAKISSRGEVPSDPQSWAPSTITVEDWLQVDLGHERTLNSVTVAARCCQYTNQFVKEYTLQYSSDGSTFTDYGNLQGPQADGLEATVTLDPTITARYIKFVVVDYNSYPSMRVEVGEVTSTSTSTCSAVSDACALANTNAVAIAEIKTKLIAEGSERETRFAARMPGTAMIDDGMNHDVVNWSYKDIIIVSLLVANLAAMMYNICTCSSQRKSHGKSYRVQYNEDTEAEAINM